MKHFIIDTFNVINKSNFIKSKAKNDKNTAIAIFIELIKNYQVQYPSYQFTLVCDGEVDEPINLVGKLRLISSKEQNADDFIKKMIQKSANKTNLVVVSSDLEVYSFAKANLCETETAENFLKTITKSTKSEKKEKFVSYEKPQSASRREIEEFKKLFGVENE